MAIVSSADVRPVDSSSRCALHTLPPQFSMAAVEDTVEISIVSPRCVCFILHTDVA